MFLTNVCMYLLALPVNEKDDLSELLAERAGLNEVFNPEARIVGGHLSGANQHPWSVSMQHGGGHRCGSCLYRANRVLTAAHCLHGIAAGALSVRAGSLASASGGQLIGVAAIVRHPQYNANTLQNDIAIFHMGGSFNTGLASITALPLPGQGVQPATGAMATVTGWGHMTEGGSNSPNLRWVNVPIVAQATCNAQYGGRITGDMICAGFPHGGQDACQNDSGGPLSFNGFLIGVVSWGEGCARPNRSGVYARVSWFTNWINANS